MGMLGAMAGAGAGIGEVADRRIKAFDEQQMMAMKDQAEQAREARILEAQRGNMAIVNQYKIDAENRGIENRKKEQQSELDFKTDPENVKRLAEAGVTAQQIKDQYGDSRYSTELAQAVEKARAIDQATYHSPANADIDRQLKEIQLKEARDGLKVPEGTKLALKEMQSERESIDDRVMKIQSSLSAMQPDSPEYLAAHDSIVALDAKKERVQGKINSLVSKWNDSPESKYSGVNIVGIDKTQNSQAEEDSIQAIEADPARAMLEKKRLSDEMQKMGYKADFSKNASYRDIYGAYQDALKDSKGKDSSNEKSRQNLIEEIDALTNNQFDISALKGKSIEEVKAISDDLKKKSGSVQVQPVDNEKWVSKAAKGVLGYGARKGQEWGNLIRQSSGDM